MSISNITIKFEKLSAKESSSSHIEDFKKSAEEVSIKEDVRAPIDSLLIDINSKGKLIKFSAFSGMDGDQNSAETQISARINLNNKKWG